MEDSHPLLRGGRRKEKGYSHGFSTSQMHVLASICDILFPSILLNKQVSQDESLSSFYSTSGSQFPFPDEVLFHQIYPFFNVFFLSIIYVVILLNTNCIPTCSGLGHDTHTFDYIQLIQKIFWYRCVGVVSVLVFHSGTP